MEIILKRNIDVKSYDALATIGVESEKHAFLLRALELAHEQELVYSNIDHRMINEKLIMRPAEHVMGKRILELLLNDGFIEAVNNTVNDDKNRKEYRITELGETMVANNVIVTKETGPIILHVSTDSILKDYILGYEIQKVSTSEEYNQLQERIRQKIKNESTAIIPEWLKQYPQDMKHDKPARIELITTGKALVVYEIERPILALKEPGISVQITLTLGSSNPPELKAMANKNGKTIPVVNHNFWRDCDSVFRELLGSRQDDLIMLENGEYALLSSPDELSDLEKNSMISNMTFPTPNIEGFGKSDDVLAHGIRLLPREENDAVSWATWLLLERIKDYTNQERYNKLKEECAGLFTERFPTNDVNAKMPSFETMIRAVKAHRESNPRLYWHMITPTILTAERS